MDCCEFNRMLDNYENLTETELSGMNSHAAECGSCRSELEFYRSIVNTAAAIPVPDPPADILDKVNSRIDSMSVTAKWLDGMKNGVRRNSRYIMTVAACLAVGLIVGLNNKAIKDRLTDNSTDGVISTSVAVTDSDGREIGDYEIMGEAESTEEPEVTMIVAESSETPQPTAVPAVVKPTPMPTKPTPVPTKPTPMPAKPTNVPAKPTPQPAATAAPITVTPAPVVTAAPTENTSGSSRKNYVIARGNYHIPEADAATPAPTAEPQSVEITGERYQIAMGSYEVSEEEKAELLKNRLIVNESDIKTIIDCMNKAKVRGMTNGYRASSVAFANFLAMLDAEGVYYNYIENTPSTSEVTFILLTN